MKASILCSDYPSTTQSIQLISKDDKSNIKLEVITELIDEVATKILVITTSVVGTDKTDTTIMKLNKDDSTDLTIAIKNLISLM